MDEQQKDARLSKSLSEGNLSRLFRRDKDKEIDLDDQSLSYSSRGTRELESDMNNETTPIQTNMDSLSISRIPPAGLAILSASPQFTSNRSSPSLISLSSASPPKFHLHELGSKQLSTPPGISTSELFIGTTGYINRPEVSDRPIK